MQNNTMHKKGVTLFILFFLFSITPPSLAADNASLRINFPGLKNVHTQVRTSDGIASSASGTLLKRSNWKTENTIIEVPKGQYDLVITKGAGKLIIDDVDCSSGHCTVNDIVATLQIHFPGLRNVHSSVHVPDGTDNLASGGKINNKNWQKEKAIIPVLRQIVDVNVRHGAANSVVDGVDCRSGNCSVDDLTANLTVSFPGLSSVHTSVHIPDNTTDSATGKKVSHLNWKKNQANLVVLRQSYDLSIKKGAETINVDNVDCRSGSCQVNDLVALLTIDFPELRNVHSSVRLVDNVANQAQGQQVTYKNWQSNQTQIVVFKNQYDLFIRHGAGSIAIDNVDCSSGSCLVNNLTSTLTVAFPGISNVHTSVRKSDGLDNNATGKEVAKKNWQKEQAVITFLPGVYDIQIRKGSDTIVFDDVDCSASSCLIDNFTAQMTVKFPGLNSTHTSVYPSNNIDGTISGKKVSAKNWQTDQAVLTVFKQKYDVKIQRKNALAIIKDDVDCRSGVCTVDNLVATMTVKFPNMQNVHTAIHEPDNQAGSATGNVFNYKNWQKNQAVITVLRQTYDAQIKTSNSAPIIIDNVDCTSGNCTIDEITAMLTVKFPEMRSVHTSVFVPDGKTGTVGGSKAFRRNWQNNQTEMTVFKQKYDIGVHKNNSELVVIDNVDCTSGACVVDQLTATLTVNFPELNAVHTSVRIPDNTNDSADGKEVSNKNWQKNKAKLTVFKQQYDVRVKKGLVTKIIDNVDCSSGVCNIDELTSILTINFPGLMNVHSSAHLSDGIDNQATGSKAARSNWKTHQTRIPLLRETYDVKVNHQIESVFDNVDCHSGSCAVLIKGNVQAVLVNGDANTPIADKTITAYEKSADGSLNRIMKGKTTADGQINFTLEGISAGKIYVLKTYNPLGNKKSYYSSFISQEGDYQFIVTADGENTLDLVPPTVAFTSPLDGSSVSNLGFPVTGIATDNRNIDRIELTVNDTIKGSRVITGNYNAATQSWTANVSESMITLDSDVTLSARVYDQAQNQSVSTITVSVVKDIKGPDITITSHVENDEVPVTGFLLSGTVTDLTGVATLKASLVDSSMGNTVNNQNVSFSISNGNWTMVVDNGLMTEDGTIDVTFTATDTVGNISSETIHLLVVAVDYSNAHMINRITFGATPKLIQEVNTIGALNYLEQQLNPASIDDSELSNMITTLPTTKEELQAWTLMHMAYSQRQLLEVMTWFWDNHFNTDINTSRTNAHGIELDNTAAFELAENQNFRSNALGNFRDLLGISAKSPAMLIYLDSISNIVDDSNENYSREVDELHTMGVNGGYTDKDVEIGAEIFTGWHLQNGSFFFDESLHSIGSYTLFEGTPEEIFIPEGGVIQGELLLDALSTHPSTASYICTKLVTVFVDDTPPASLITRCAAEFLNSSAADNQIEQVLRLILQSAEFNDVTHYRSKIKTPVEFVVGAIRNLEATSNATDLISPVRAMGIRLYENPVPTGWSETGNDWVNSSLLIERLKWVNTFVRNESSADTSSSNPIQFYQNNGFETPEGIVGFLLQLTVGDDFTELARDNALNGLGITFDLTQPDADSFLRQLNGNVMSYPQYQFQ